MKYKITQELNDGRTIKWNPKTLDEIEQVLRDQYENFCYEVFPSGETVFYSLPNNQNRIVESKKVAPSRLMVTKEWLAYDVKDFDIVEVTEL